MISMGGLAIANYIWWRQSTTWEQNLYTEQNLFLKLKLLDFDPEFSHQEFLAHRKVELIVICQRSWQSNKCCKIKRS